MNRPVVFISYSWDSEEHKNWVLKLSNDLIQKYGIDVLLDQYELSAGKDLTYFMESSIEKATKVLLVLTPNYKLKAENREGGVGYEYSMISQELFEIQAGNNKFIPILRNGNLDSSSPKYIKTKIFHNMRDDSENLSQLFELSRIIYEKPKIVKPALGSMPNFDENDYDPILEQVNEFTERERRNNELDQIINSEEGVKLANIEVDNLFNTIQEKAQRYSEKSQLNFNVQIDYRRNIIVKNGGYSVSILWSQKYSNTLQDSILRISYWKGNIALNSYNTMYFPGKEPKQLKEVDYEFNIDFNNKNIWRMKDKSEKTSQEIIKETFSYIIEQLKKNKENSFRLE